MARKFFTKLETYRIPRDLVGRPGRDGVPIPRKLFPVFRDRDELPLSADLGSSIEDALRASRYLIVFCTPDAAQSQWVNEEIRYFKSLGREDRILAIMARGEPNASDQPGRAVEECFPPALRYRIGPDGKLTEHRCEPVAGDLRAGGDGWTACLLKAVAGITGLGYDAFAKRQAKRDRIRNGFAALAVLLLMGGLTGWWDYTRTKVAYYAQMTERWGVPQGAVRLVETTVRHRQVSFRVESSRQKVRRVLRANSAGQLQDDAENYHAAIQEVAYREDGSIEQISLRDHNGRVVARRQFTPVRQETDGPVIFIEFKAEHQDAPLALPSLPVSFEGLSSPSDASGKSDITVHRVAYREDGLPERVSYLNAYRQLAATGEGVFGQAFRHNGSGLPSEVTHLGYDGKPAPAKGGILTRRTQWDAHGNEVQNSAHDKDGKPIPTQKLWARRTSSYDQHGNVLGNVFFGTDGKPALHKDGFAKATAKYDERGNQIEVAYFGTDGLPVLLKDGYARFTAKYDERGNQIEVAYFGTDGQPVLLKDGYAQSTQKYDERRNRIEEAYFGTDGQPVLLKDGYARFTEKYDERDNRFEAAYFGTDGQPVLLKDGYAKSTQKYDERGNLVEIALFGIGDVPVAPSGWARAVVTSDRVTGQKLQTVHYNLQGEVVQQY